MYLAAPIPLSLTTEDTKHIKGLEAVQARGSGVMD